MKPEFPKRQAWRMLTPDAPRELYFETLQVVPRADWTEFIHRQYSAVAPGGRLIVAHYRNPDEEPLDPGSVIEHAGYPLGGRTSARGASLAWIQRQP
jgi:hypothetical protein